MKERKIVQSRHKTEEDNIQANTQDTRHKTEDRRKKQKTQEKTKKKEHRRNNTPININSIQQTKHFQIIMMFQNPI